MKTIVRICVVVMALVSLTNTGVVSVAPIPARGSGVAVTINQFGPKIFVGDTGWSEPSVGEWDAETRTAKLTQDIGETIQIVSDNIVLDGNGHTLTGIDDEIGVWIVGRTGVTVKNITVEHFRDGIRVQLSSNTTVIGNSLFYNTYAGIYLLDSDDNVISGNTVSFHSDGVFAYRSERNTLINNTFLNNSAGIAIDLTRGFTISGNQIAFNNNGIYLGLGGSHTVRDNTVSRNTGPGIILDWSSGNQIFHNDFLFNGGVKPFKQAQVYGTTDNAFNLPAPVGGNFWNDWIWPDDDRDDFVDYPYIFSGGQDSLPWALPNGWETPGAPPGITVTGGGWIDSPPGAYITNPTLEGKATFGFVFSNNKKTEVPTGSLEFHFKDAGLVFKSDTFESFRTYRLFGLNGDRIQLQGTGTINGSGDYGFRAIATDVKVERGEATADRFHIEIWDLSSSKSIYNVKLAPIGGAVLLAGNISIHTR